MKDKSQHEVACPQCDQRLRYSKSRQVRLRCPKCRYEFAVPGNAGGALLPSTVGLPTLVGLLASGRKEEAQRAAKRKLSQDKSGDQVVELSRGALNASRFGRWSLALIVMGAFGLGLTAWLSLDRRSPKAMLEDQASILGTEWEAVSIEAAEDDLRLLLTDKSRVFFGVDQSALSITAQGKLRFLAETMTRRNSLDITGHADSTGRSEYNRDLSMRRAKVVRDFLLAAGLRAGKIDLHGLGEEAPIVPETDDISRSLNRRVDIEVRATEAKVGFSPWFDAVTRAIEHSPITVWLTLIASLITIASGIGLLIPKIEKAVTRMIGDV